MVCISTLVGYRIFVVQQTAATVVQQVLLMSKPLPPAALQMLCLLTVVLLSVCAGIDAVVVPGAVPGLPLPVTLVDEGLVLALKERIRSMAMQVVGIRKDAQYQVWWPRASFRSTCCSAPTSSSECPVAT